MTFLRIGRTAIPNRTHSRNGGNERVTRDSPRANLLAWSPSTSLPFNVSFVMRSAGARPLRRALQKYVEDPLSEAFIRGTIKPGQPVTIFAEGDKLGLRQTDAVEEPLSV